MTNKKRLTVNPRRRDVRYRIARELSGIDYSDLTTAERNIRNIVGEPDGLEPEMEARAAIAKRKHKSPSKVSYSRIMVLLDIACAEASCITRSTLWYDLDILRTKVSAECKINDVAYYSDVV